MTRVTVFANVTPTLLFDLFVSLKCKQVNIKFELYKQALKVSKLLFLRTLAGLEVTVCA